MEREFELSCSYEAFLDRVRRKVPPRTDAALMQGTPCYEELSAYSLRVACVRGREGCTYDFYLTPQSNGTLRVRVSGAEERGLAASILTYLPYLLLALFTWWAVPFPGAALLPLAILGLSVRGRRRSRIYREKLLRLLREDLELPL